MKSKKSYATPVLTELGNVGLDTAGSGDEVVRAAREMAVTTLRACRKRKAA